LASPFRHFNGKECPTVQIELLVNEAHDDCPDPQKYVNHATNVTTHGRVSVRDRTYKERKLEDVGFIFTCRMVRAPETISKVLASYYSTRKITLLCDVYKTLVHFDGAACGKSVEFLKDSKTVSQL
jgi:hypothetical protein